MNPSASPESAPENILKRATLPTDLKLSTEERLRADNRIQDDLETLTKLGFSGTLPLISQELIEEADRTDGTIVLLFKTHFKDYKRNLEAALSSEGKNCHLAYLVDSLYKFSIKKAEPEWVCVPNTVRADTLGLSKVEALNQIPGSRTCDPMELLLMIGYHNLKTGEQIAGFKNKLSFTSVENTVVGSHTQGTMGVALEKFMGRVVVGFAPSFAAKTKSANDSRSQNESINSLKEEQIKSLITSAGGIFIGKDALVMLGKISADTVIPDIPEKFSQVFLNSQHPLRERKIASHIILAFDPDSNQWHAIDRGEGGQTDIVPGSLGKDGYGLSAEIQHELLKIDGLQINVEGLEMISPQDSFPIERILANARELHFEAGKETRKFPFCDIWARTADTQRSPEGCPAILINYRDPDEQNVSLNYPAELKRHYIGLIAVWI